LADRSTRPAVFLDRDGVLVEEVHFLTSADQLKLLPGVADALRALQERFSIIVVTNQSGIARGYLTENDLTGIHGSLAILLAAEEVGVDAFYYCPHLAEGTVAAYRQDCACRKPQPGMLLRASEDFGIDLARSFLVGDMPRDIQAGDAAGVKSILLSEHGDADAASWMIAKGISEAADLILAATEVIGSDSDSPDHRLGDHDSIAQRGSNCR
jgi:D-glycero-D-manno-heptose 1,7-bisphosphate phosphatase